MIFIFKMIKNKALPRQLVVVWDYICFVSICVWSVFAIKKNYCMSWKGKKVILFQFMIWFSELINYLWPLICVDF